MRALGLGLVAGLLVWVATGCGGDDKATVNVYAAASLSEAFEDLAEQFEAANPNVKVNLSFAGSARLAAQIEAGAQADVFASADLANMDRVTTAGRAAGMPFLFARNSLALVVPTGNPGDVKGLGDLANDDLVVAVCAPEVPCGVLAEAVLGDAGVAVNADTEETSVRAVLTKVMLGEADAGLVYATDVAAGDDDVEEVPIGPQTQLNHYPVVALGDKAEGAHFVVFVISTDGLRILHDHGFEAPSDSLAALFTIEAP